MRGKHQSRVRGGTGKRNIPAYAGKTTTAGMVSMPAAEHPRVCGENVIPTSERPELMGTSPRMRGKPDDDVIEAVQKRNIPAYVGKTTRRSSWPMRTGEHPRVCGENYGSIFSAIEVSGTSPRMRGKLVSWVVWLGLTWNIPAYAGKTGKPERVLTHQEGTSPRMRGKLRFRMPRLSCNQEHPRVCGEN